MQGQPLIPAATSPPAALPLLLLLLSSLFSPCARPLTQLGTLLLSFTFLHWLSGSSMAAGAARGRREGEAARSLRMLRAVQAAAVAAARPRVAQGGAGRQREEEEEEEKKGKKEEEEEGGAWGRRARPHACAAP